MRFLRSAFTVGFLALAVLAVNLFSFDSAKTFDFFVLPFLALCLWYQTRDPVTRLPLERHELRTDIISLAVVILFTVLQNRLIHLYYHRLCERGPAFASLTPEVLRLGRFPLWAECILAFLAYDFLFYATHRMAHGIPFLWKLHAMHHAPNKMTYLNSNRVHPLDLVFRRYGPIVVLLALGISQNAFIFVGVIVNVFGPITHLNIKLRHGPLNYLIGTNEVHIWHHSADPREAKNYGITMLWDHLFGTYFFPTDRRMPDKLGLTAPEGIPVHDYLRQVFLSATVKRDPG